ncbi:hypothetical protein Tco_1099134, partial [Tanacetum coccineum]
EKQHQPEDIQELLHKLLKDLQIISEELAEYISPSWNCPTFYDDDDAYTIQYKEYLENSSNETTPDLPTEEPDKSLSMGDEHLSTIRNRIRRSNKVYDVDSFDDIDYVEASPPDSELISLEEVKDDILHEKLLNINLLIAKIESLNDNPTPDCVLKSPSLFPIPVEDSDSFFEKRGVAVHYSAKTPFPEYDSFLFEIEPDQGKLTSVVMEDIVGEPRVHVPNVLPTHPTLILDSDFIPSDDSLRSDLEVSFPFGTRNKIFDPGIFFEVQSKRFLSRDTFSISFIHNPLCPVIETLLPFSSKNEDKVFNPGILPSNLLSHQGKITSDFLRAR